MENSRPPLVAVGSQTPSENAGAGAPATGVHAIAGVTAEEKNLLRATPDSPSDKPSPDADHKVSRELLINRLNFIHFQDDCIQIHFVHRRYDRRLLISAIPQPCFGSQLECRWAHPAEMSAVLQSFDLDYILVPRGRRFVHAVPAVVAIDAERVRLELPAVGREISHRKVERQACRNISVRALQNAFEFQGRLLDFNAFSFRVELNAPPPQRFEWIDPKLPLNMVFNDGTATLFSGDCKITRSTQGESVRNYVLEPIKQEIHRFQKAEIRSQRQELTPSPNLVLRHPLTGRRVDLKVIDLSGSGFAVEEDEHAAVLMPGLILPEVELWFANSFKLTCSVQVVSRNLLQRKAGSRIVRCGLALMDMPAQDHVKLLAMLHQSKDRNAYICNELDLEALWDFLFETGFIYPEKYALIHKKKKEIKDTYEKLYTRNPQIARHFVYQDNGVILGHVAMIRFWQNTWLIHHHAARKTALNKAGLRVLDQISRFTHDTLRFRSLHMDHLACYYRPQNRFPHRVFGGFTQHLKDPKMCSIDPFAYMSLSHLPLTKKALPAGWQLMPVVDRDVVDLNDYYSESSGGLMLKALDLEPAGWRMDSLSEDYRRAGLKRDRRLLALSYRRRLKAFIIVNVSEIGLNLSDLTTCLQAIITDAEGLAPDILIRSLRLASQTAGLDEMVALVYPAAYPQKHGLPIDKMYNLWIVNTFGADQAYLKYLGRLTRYI
ncbi:MAG: hypothetical protein R6V84_14610 [Desulfobacterales bacterium]